MSQSMVTPPNTEVTVPESTLPAPCIREKFSLTFVNSDWDRTVIIQKNWSFGTMVEFACGLSDTSSTTVFFIDSEKDDIQVCRRP